MPWHVKTMPSAPEEPAREELWRRDKSRKGPASRSPNGLGLPASRPGLRLGWCRRPRRWRALRPRLSGPLPPRRQRTWPRPRPCRPQSPRCSLLRAARLDRPPTLQLPRVLGPRARGGDGAGGPAPAPPGGPVGANAEEDWNDSDSVLADLARPASGSPPRRSHPPTTLLPTTPSTTTARPPGCPQRAGRPGPRRLQVAVTAPPPAEPAPPCRSERGASRAGRGRRRRNGPRRLR